MLIFITYDGKNNILSNGTPSVIVEYPWILNYTSTVITVLGNIDLFVDFYGLQPKEKKYENWSNIGVL